MAVAVTDEELVAPSDGPHGHEDLVESLSAKERCPGDVWFFGMVLVPQRVFIYKQKALPNTTKWFAQPERGLFVGYGSTRRARQGQHLGAFEANLLTPAVEVPTRIVEGVAKLDEHVE